MADESQSLQQAAMSRLDEHIAKHRTLGAYLNYRDKTIIHPQPGQAVVRAKSHRVKLSNKRDPEKAVEKNDWEFFVRRSMVEAEFEELWNTQKAFHPEVLTEAAKQEIETAIFFQRKLRPVDPGRCTLLPERRRAYRAFPIVQALIAIRTVHDLQILDDKFQGTALNQAQRQVIIKLLLSGKDLTWIAIKKHLHLPKALFNFENGGDGREGIDGDQTAKVLSNKKYFGSRWHDFSELLKHKIVWRILNTQVESKLTQWLVQVTGVSSDTAKAISKASLPTGVQQFSMKVVNGIVKQYQAHQQDAALLLHQAIEKAGFGSHSAVSHFEQTGELLDELPKEYGQYLARHVGLNGRIANPTVHIGMNQIRTVVNALIKKYGKPTQIHLELARDLKLNAKQKEKLNKQNSQNRAANTARRKKYFETFGRNPTPDDLEKMTLWEELNPKDCMARQCVYTGKAIGTLRALFSPEVQVEHILPKWLVLDESLNNKTLSFVSANQAKGEKTPYEAFGDNPVINGFTYDYEEILHRTKNMRKEKYMRFAPNAMEWWLGNSKSIPEKYLNETRHLSAVAREYLSLICPQKAIVCGNGRLTAAVREGLHLNLILNSKNRKNRNDHRHHAVDACVIGIIDAPFIQTIQTVARKQDQIKARNLASMIPEPWPDFFNSVKRVIDPIKVSHRPDHSFEGELFKEKHAYGFDREGNIIQQKKASTDEPEDTKEGMRGYNRKDVVGINHRLNVRDVRAPFGETKRPYKGYPSSGNYCLEIIETPSGDWISDAIPRYIAYEKALALGGKAHEISKMARIVYEHKLSLLEGKLVMKLMRQDCISITEDIRSPAKILKLTQISQNGGTFCEIHEANESARARSRGEAKRKIAKDGLTESLKLQEKLAFEDTIFVSQISAKKLKIGKARRVTISPIGELRDPRFKE
ncbi:MAG: type II CRISPR RNA-guided endonuclease Cas9 [Brachymonas sp.]|nr:type II CRISPR RNA-guided endonuclease Cas9 [Brachymonas sp.]